MASANLLPICFACKRLRGVSPGVGWACDAYPGSIPVEILSSYHDHRLPFVGDHGLTFEPEASQHDMKLATDPPVSEAQRRLVWATATGHGRSDMPVSVAKEFTSSDPGGHLPKTAKDMTKGGFRHLINLLSEFFSEEAEEPEHQQGFDGKPIKGRAASVAFTTADGKVLLVRRAKDEKNYPDTWSLPGGHLEGDEDFETAAQRECREEIGDCTFDGMKELNRTRTPNDFEHVTFAVPVKDTFTPKLNKEHYDSCWADVAKLPEPIHPGVRKTIDGIILDATAHDPKNGQFTSGGGSGSVPDAKAERHLKESKDPSASRVQQKMALSDLRNHLTRTHGVKEGLKKYGEMTGSTTFNYLTQDDPSFDSPMAHDEMPLAMDRRVLDDDGRLHVNDSIITSAEVNPYIGREIPGWEQLKLDPDKKYMLYRDPAELEKSVKSFNGIPILSQHKPVTADTPSQDLVIGAVSNPRWEAPNIIADLVFWTKDAIDEIQNGKKADLSAGYAYKPVMSPIMVDGKVVDGKMADVVANHLAQVSQGRVSNAHVADSIEFLQWAAIERAVLTI